ncbi:uncharacterized protein C2orf80 homolog isoform X3 [Sphaerodactylus townsendi]|uniref:uncharacterized protein C2orf80 homolog isoform X3 n=1 Tax=Sphaerodactylus townsendi TaxID=933632 RepID=UPI00202647C5|nr:uncharacterized protein C2orf80 homolog isoform X3 [Sphaerodactylus townsendi]
MERKHLKKEIGKLLVEYVGIRLRENAFDPQGKKQTNFLDDLAHHDLAANAALSWLSDLEAQTSLGNEKTKLSQWQKILSLNRTEREALILSSYAEMVMGHLIHPRNLSRHPFAMLTAPKAAEHAWKQSIKAHRASANRNPTRSSTERTAANDERGGLPF